MTTAEMRECVRCGSGGGPQPCVDENGLCCLCRKNLGIEDAPAAARRFCKARSAMTDTGLYRCTLAEGHEGPHKSATATWHDGTGFAAASRDSNDVERTWRVWKAWHLIVTPGKLAAMLGRVVR